MSAFTCCSQPYLESICWRLSKEGRVFCQIVHLKRPDREVVVEVSQRPNSLFLWLNLFRNLPDSLHNLCITQKIMNELSVGRSEEPFAHRSIAWFCPGA